MRPSDDERLRFDRERVGASGGVAIFENEFDHDKGSQGYTLRMNPAFDLLRQKRRRNSFV